MQHIITTFPFLLTFSAFLAEGIEGLFLSALSLFLPAVFVVFFFFLVFFSFFDRKKDFLTLDFGLWT